MMIGILKEPSFETRVSLIPETAAWLIKKGFEVSIESGAGENSFWKNADYQSLGVSIATREEIISKSQVLLSIHAPDEKELARFKNKILIGVYKPLFAPSILSAAKENNLSVFSLDLLPRTTRAQSMDVLSSQANIAGYKAVLLAANTYPRYFPMFMTAAGSIPPAKVLILGAGVAGLQAIATARRLGAVVEVFDTRTAVKEEVMSLGAKFVEIEGAADASAAGGYAVEQSEEYKQKQAERIAESLAKADIIITTAQIPGRKAPILISEEAFKKIKAGSIIIDLASATGGNTPYTKDNETVNINGVRIIGDSNLPATMPSDASKMYGKNVANFLQILFSNKEEIEMNWQDELVKESCVCHHGNWINERMKSVFVN